MFTNTFAVTAPASPKNSSLKRLSPEYVKARLYTEETIIKLQELLSTTQKAVILIKKSLASFKSILNKKIANSKKLEALNKINNSILSIKINNILNLIVENINILEEKLLIVNDDTELLNKANRIILITRASNNNLKNVLKEYRTEYKTLKDRFNKK